MPCEKIYVTSHDSYLLTVGRHTSENEHESSLLYFFCSGLYIHFVSINRKIYLLLYWLYWRAVSFEKLLLDRYNINIRFTLLNENALWQFKCDYNLSTYTKQGKFSNNTRKCFSIRTFHNYGRICKILTVFISDESVLDSMDHQSCWVYPILSVKFIDVRTGNSRPQPLKGKKGLKIVMQFLYGAIPEELFQGVLIWMVNWPQKVKA